MHDRFYLWWKVITQVKTNDWDWGRKRERCDRSVRTVLSNKRPKRTSDILSEVFQKLLFLPAFQLHRFSISLFWVTYLLVILHGNYYNHSQHLLLEIESFFNISAIELISHNWIKSKIILLEFQHFGTLRFQPRSNWKK